jgi:hypothetical protein
MGYLFDIQQYMAQLFQIWPRRMAVEKSDVLEKTGDETVEKLVRI